MGCDFSLFLDYVRINQTYLEGEIMNTWQKVINVCVAVIVTLLIYQNQQLKDKIDISQGSAQLDVVKTLERLNSIEDDLKRITKTLVTETEPNRLDDLEDLVLSIVPKLLKTQNLDEKQDRDINELNRNVRDLKNKNKNFKQMVFNVVGEGCRPVGGWILKCLDR